LIPFALVCKWGQLPPLPPPAPPPMPFVRSYMREAHSQKIIGPSLALLLSADVNPTSEFRRWHNQCGCVGIALTLTNPNLNIPNRNHTARTENRLEQIQLSVPVDGKCHLRSVRVILIGYNQDLTSTPIRLLSAVRPRNDHSTTYVTTVECRLLHCTAT